AWAEDGSKDATMRATAVWQQALNVYTPPAMDVAVVEALDEFVAKRKEERKGAQD
ncbi:MAG: trimethylamine methyltransferase family protein, partial [Rhodospirillaceae bacterium]|nr:trimethylamine methyltransferase family protein [Rhodospirillaceae bacterium]